jgi:hypothetical protein
VFRPLDGTQTLSEAYGIWPAISRNPLVPRLLDNVMRSLVPRRATRAAGVP